jgi:hypothetical protein
MFAAHINLAGRKLDVLKLNISNAIIGFSLYFLFPAMGPKYAYVSFPQLPASVVLGPALLPGVPNAMPSLHIASTYFTFVLARPWKWLRYISGAYLGLMVLGVFSTGEHYMMDVIVAVPYALAMLAFSSTSRQRKFIMLTGTGMLFGWLLVLRYGAVVPALTWGLTLTTLVLGVLIERRLGQELWGQPHAAVEACPNLAAVAVG